MRGPFASIFVIAAALPLAGQSPLIWFCPLDPLLRPEVGYGGSPQYMQLFDENASWQRASSRVQVFKIYPQWITRGSDDDLRTQFADLKRRGIALTLEWGMLTASADCGRGVEGFGGQAALSAVRRIQRLGGDLRYIAMDEPIFFGTLYRGANACRWTVEQMAQNAAANIKAVRAEFPGVTIGDIEPLPVDSTDKNWLDQYARGIDALQTATGEPLAFFHSDVLWNANRWSAALGAMRDVVRSRGLPFGVIYNGNSSDLSDAGWVAAAESHMTAYEAGADPPDHVIFQSWHPQPKQLLPEDEPSSFTSLINRYFRTRTTLTASASDTLVSGTLSGAGPVHDAMVRISAVPLSGNGTETEFVVEGVTPAGIQQIVLGLRVNLECECDGSSEFRLRSFRFESGGTTMIRDFAAGLAGWGVSDRSAVAIEGGQLHVRVKAGQPLLINSAPVAFANESAAFKLTVTATIAPPSDSGYFAAIFLGARELSRVRIPIAAREQELGGAVTGEDGRFEFPLPKLAPADWLIRAVFGGNDDLWPARGTVVRRDGPNAL